VGVAVDKKNRVFTTEQEPGRLQVFQYVTESEAAAEKTKHEEELAKAADQRRKAALPAVPDKRSEAAPPQPPDPPTPKDSATPN